MEELNIGQRLHDYQVKKASGQDVTRNEREDLAKQMLNPLNESRVAAGFKPMPLLRFYKIVTDIYGGSNYKVLRELKKRADSFDDFSKGVGFLLKK